ncbi:MAG: hypothetical protein JWR16_2412 [Nevskia sp.]|nr:hypothetical protein [Nevskia sp.]
MNGPIKRSSKAPATAPSLRIRLEENMNNTRTPACAAFAAALALGFGIASPAALALSYDYQGVGIALDTRLTEGVSIRAEGRDPLLIGISHGGKAYSNNADLGDLNFAAGDVANAVSRITSSLQMTWKDYGLFTRANYTFDPTAVSNDFFGADKFGAGHQYPDSVRKSRNDAIQSEVGSKLTLLDLYVYGNFDISGHSLNVKLGRQVINWGESTLVLNGLNSLVAVNANRAYTPGLELDEVAIPAGQLFMSMNLIKNVSAEAFYQFQWQRSIAAATGTYFETNDYVGPGGIAGNIDYGRAVEYAAPGSACVGFPAGVSCVPYGGSIPRAGGDRRAPGNGQYGGALRFSLPSLNSTELALYAANYHSRLPLYSTFSASSGNQDASTASIFAEYPKDIHMFGMSFNTALPFGFALQGEYSYKDNQPLEIDDVEQSLADLGAPSQINPNPGATLGNQYIRGYRRKGVSLADIGTTKVFSPSTWFGYDDLLLISEIAIVHVHNLEDESVLRYEGPGTFLPGDARGAAISAVPMQQGGFATSTSWGYKILARATYNNIMANYVPGLSFKPAMRWEHDVGGVTPAPLYNFVRGSRVLSPIAGFGYKNNTTAEFGYAYYFGGGQGNLIRDRDYAFFDVKYSF